LSRRFEVRLGAVPVGELSELPDGGSEFRFYDSYRALDRRPVLGQKFEDDLEKTYRSRKAQRLPDFFANLIPEGRLRRFIEEEAGLEEGDDLGVLAYVGRDLPGAVVLADLGSQALPASIEAEPAPTDAPDPLAEAFRFSLAGVQLKFSMLREDEKLSLPASDRAGEWIVKFPSPTFSHLPENEYSMLAWAAAAGLAVPEAHLHPVEHLSGVVQDLGEPGSSILALRRYDRRADGQRIHQEDFAQAVGLPPTRKYAQLTYEMLAVLLRNFIDEDAVDEFVRRLSFVIAAGNNDAHLKNWSLVYPNGIQARWSPLYDQVSTVAWTRPKRELALKLAGVKEFARIDRTAFERFAGRAAADQSRVLEEVDATLERLRSVWREIESDLPLSAEHRQALREHWRRVPLLRDAGGLG
jgi:serine/threonine-protein kinase HipA